jgi:hypothetical protein
MEARMQKAPSKKTPKKNLAMLIPAELHDWLSHHAIDLDTSARAIVQRLLEEYRKTAPKKKSI